MSEIKVLDHGIVKLIDHMGDDARIVETARASISGKEVRATTEDRLLIRYLLRHKHTSPFEQVKFTFFVKMPIFVARQWIRHRTMSVNEMSARYGVLPSEFYVPETPKFQSNDNKQGSGEAIPEPLAEKVRQAIIDHGVGSFALYHELLGDQDPQAFLNFDPDDVAELKSGGGLARELARAVLPVNTYTQWYHTVDLWNLMHFMRLRLDPHAQYEIRVYAQAIYDLVKDVCPIALEAFEDYILKSVTFSRKEMELLRDMLQAPVDVAQFMQDCTDSDMAKVLGSKREVVEFKKKLGYD